MKLIGIILVSLAFIYFGLESRLFGPVTPAAGRRNMARHPSMLATLALGTGLVLLVLSCRYFSPSTQYQPRLRRGM